MKSIKSFIPFIALANGLSAAVPSPTSPASLGCEPQVFFLLGMSSHAKIAGSSEAFSAREQAVSAVYDRLAYSVASALKLIGFEGTPGSQDWHKDFVRYIDQYYVKSVYGDSESLVFDSDACFAHARRTSSLDAYLAGALFRYMQSTTLDIPSAEKALSVAHLITRRTDRGVVVHTYIGYTPGGSKVEFMFNKPLQEILSSSSEFTVGNLDARRIPDQSPRGRARYHISYQRPSKVSPKTSEVRLELAYRLAKSEQGGIVSDEESPSRLDVDIDVADSPEGRSVITDALSSVEALSDSKVTKEAVSEARIP